MLVEPAEGHQASGRLVIKEQSYESSGVKEHSVQFEFDCFKIEPRVIIFLHLV
jgi:hypothetical protein